MSSHHKRKRGTAVVFNKGKVLLVKDKGTHLYSLPGGGINKGERSLNAACRELNEELGMRSKNAKRMHNSDIVTDHTIHKVSIIESDDNPVIMSRELVKFTWWDGKSNIPRYHHVDQILGKLKKNNPSFITKVGRFFSNLINAPFEEWNAPTPRIWNPPAESKSEMEHNESKIYWG